jgi:hypothetical protein
MYRLLVKYFNKLGYLHVILEIYPQIPMDGHWKYETVISTKIAHCLKCLKSWMNVYLIICKCSF